MPDIWTYTGPVYSRIMLYAYMHGLDWSTLKGNDPETFVRNNYRQLDLGRMTGKTTAIVTFCDDHDGCIVVTQTLDQANNLSRRHNLRAFAVEEMMKVKPDRFSSSDPMFIFDDVSCHNVLEVMARHKPRRFIHIGLG